MYVDSLDLYENSSCCANLKLRSSERDCLQRVGADCIYHLLELVHL